MLKIFAVISAFISKFRASPQQVKVVVAPRETSKCPTLFKKDDLVELTDYAVEMLGRELIELYGRESTFVVVAVGDTDPILRETHRQFLLLRKRRDGMPFMQEIGGVLQSVKFTAPMVKKSRRATTTSLLQTRRKLECVR